MGRFDKPALSSFIQNDLRIRTIAAIFTDENEILVSDNAVTAVRICPLNLISQIDIVIFQKLNRRSVGKRIWQIYIRTGQQIKVSYSKSLRTPTAYHILYSNSLRKKSSYVLALYHT